MPAQAPFSGAKIALLCEGKLLVYQPDDKPGIPWPGLWDLPGGGREGDETPLACALRETFEEFALSLDPAWVNWSRRYAGKALATWFFAAQVPPGTFDRVVFGDEGQRWQVMPVADYLRLDTAIVHLQARVAECLAALPSGG